MKKVLTFLALITVLVSLVLCANAEILPLGSNGEFAVDTIEGYQYYTPDSDLSAVATTAGYMFEHYDKYVCYVLGNNHSAFIAYYPVEGITDLKAGEKIQLAMNLAYGKDAPFFQKPFLVYPWSAAYEFIQNDKLSDSATVNYSSYFIFLEHGVIEIAANANNDSSIADFTYALYDSVRVLKSNSFVY